MEGYSEVDSKDNVCFSLLIIWSLLKNTKKCPVKGISYSDIL